MYSMALFYTPCPSHTEAQKIATHLLEQKLIACAQIIPVTSMYWWDGKIANDNEYVLIAKTLESVCSQITQEIEKLHPYDIPCIMKLQMLVNEKYLAWAKKMVRV